ncbi:MAG: extracellular repeat protein, family, partial [Burkholderiaceae bacterium]|nr:extracellular repeat protein, family [Burkholderiaceae bacterium]
MDMVSSANDVNAVGDVAVGWSNISTGSKHAFRWTPATGMTDLGTLAAGNAGNSTAIGVNAAGNVVVGQAYNGTAYHAFRWTQATNKMTDLGALAAGNAGNSTAYGVNAAGDVVVGNSRDNNADTNLFPFGIADYAFRWTQSTGMTDLGTFAGGQTGYSNAYDVNAAGDVVVGQASNGTNRHAFRWTLNAGSTTQGTMTDLGTLAANKTDGTSCANRVNAAGNVVVGYANTGTATHAFRWTLNAGSTTQGTMTDLGTLAANKTDGNSFARGVNAAGDVVVGQAYTGTNIRAFRWTAATGMQTIEDWLTANGVTVNASAPKTYAAYSVNAAGDVVVGMLDNNHAFIATTKGLIDQVENNKSLAGSSGAPARAMQDAGMVMQGAHGSPMRGLLSAGKQSFWTAGDWGHSDNQGNDGNLGAVEVGYARGVTNDVMV